jgi:Hemerythrin HHE cation binding domain
MGNRGKSQKTYGCIRIFAPRRYPMPDSTGFSSAPRLEISPYHTCDAIELLKLGHRQVSEWFKDYDSAGTSARKQELVSRICNALQIHTVLEEEIFYPAFVEATDDCFLYDAAVHDHADLKRLIEQVVQSSPVDELFDSRVRILGDVMAQHMADEERLGGLLAEAAESAMDFDALGVQLRARLRQLERG